MYQGRAGSAAPALPVRLCYGWPGMIADLVLFDPATIADRATFQEPFVLATGMKGVWVGGVRVWDGARPTGAFPGRMPTR